MRDLAKHTFIRLLFLSVMSFMLMACSDDTISVNIPQKELQEALPERLQQAEIWYRVEEGNKFSFKQKDSEKVIAIARKIQAEIIPEGRSSNFGPEMKEIMLRKLTENNVPYELRQFGEEEWVVWPKEHHAKVVELHDEAEKEFLENLNKIADEHNRKMLQKLESGQNQVQNKI